jgi:hypothetical protein
MSGIDPSAFIFATSTPVPGFVTQLFHVTPSLAKVHLGFLQSIFGDVIAGAKAIALFVGAVLVFWGLVMFLMGSFHFGTKQGVGMASAKRTEGLKFMAFGVGGIFLVMMIATLFSYVVLPMA